MTTRVKGAVLQARRSFVREEYGEEGWERVLDALPEDDRATLRGIVLTTAWYPFELNERLDKAIVDTAGEGDVRIFEAIGARSAKENLSGPHRGFLTPGDPARFMSLTDRIYSFYYDTGSREWEAAGDTSGVMTTFDAETISQTDCMTVIGWYREALEMCGAQDVVIEHDECRAQGGKVCRYQVSWRPREPA